MTELEAAQQADQVAHDHLSVVGKRTLAARREYDAAWEAYEVAHEAFLRAMRHQASGGEELHDARACI